MKTVNNIQILKGLSADGLDIESISEDNEETIGGNHYVFKLQNRNIKGQDYEIEVFLSRNKNERGKYDMFVMGWASRTVVYLTDDDWTRPNFILYYITETLRKIK